MWKKIRHFILLLLIIDCVYDIFFPAILGSQIDRKFAKEIDTTAITQYVEYLKSNNSEDEKTVHLLYDEDTDVHTLYFYFSAEINEELSHRYPDSSVLKICIDVYPENKYSAKAKINHYWDLGFPELDTLIEIRKNNIDITIEEHTKKPRSKNAQLFLEDSLSSIGL